MKTAAIRNATAIGLAYWIVVIFAGALAAAGPVNLVGSWTTGLNHPVSAGSSRLLVFTVGWEEMQASGDRPITSVNYGGVPLTKAVRQSQSAWQGVEIWYLNEAGIQAATNSTFNISWTIGVPTVSVHYAAGTYANVDQTTPVASFNSVATPNGSPNPLTTTINAVTDGYSVAATSHGKGDGSFVWNNGWTSQTEQLDAGAISGTADHADSADGLSTVSVTKTATVTKRFVLAAVSLAPAAIAGNAANPEAGSTDVDKPGPTAFRLYGNYPNPFNPVTQIRFDLPFASQVRLDVYDILGRKTATLVDEYRLAGEHSVMWNAGQLGSGLYLYRLRADEYIATGKMMLLK